MQNSRRRREVLLLMVLTALGGEARKKKGYEILKVRGPFVAMAQVEGVISATVGEEQKQKDLLAVKKVVNDFVPGGFLMFSPELKLWFATQVVKRLVATGWKPPVHEDVINFVQSMYDLADNMHMSGSPGRVLLDSVVKSADNLRSKYGMFV